MGIYDLNSPMSRCAIHTVRKSTCRPARTRRGPSAHGTTRARDGYRTLKMGHNHKYSDVLHNVTWRYVWTGPRSGSDTSLTG